MCDLNYFTIQIRLTSKEFSFNLTDIFCAVHKRYK